MHIPKRDQTVAGMELYSESDNRNGRTFWDVWEGEKDVQMRKGWGLNPDSSAAIRNNHKRGHRFPLLLRAEIIVPVGCRDVPETN